MAELHAARAVNVVPLRVVRSRVSQDTVNCLRELLKRAERGEIIGMTFCALQPDREFFYSSCGEAHRSPACDAAMASTLMYGTMRRIFGEE